MRLSGSGFQAGSEVKIVLETPKRLQVGTVRAQDDGTFRAQVIVPKRARAGDNDIQVVGTGSSGRPTALATRVVILTAGQRTQVVPAGTDLAEPVLLTLSAGIPLATWLVLEVLGWRARRNAQ